MELIGGIEEATYGAVKGRVAWNVPRRHEIQVILSVNGVAINRAAVQDTHFELEAHEPLLPTDQVEVVASASNQATRRFKWGELERHAPQAWLQRGVHQFPSVFVLGAAKSATTSLHVYLDSHPDVFMSKPKEPFFFEAEYERGVDFYYNKYFGGWKGQKLVGESRHRNLYLPYVAQRIATYNPLAKLIVILRNPAERAVSHWWHWHSRGLDHLDAAASFEADLERIQSGCTVTLPHEVKQYVDTLGPYAQGEYRTYLDSGYYCEQLQRYFRYFSGEQLHIIYFDEFVSNPTKALNDTFAFLELDAARAAIETFVPWNQSVPGMWRHISEKTWRWLIEHYKPYNRKLEMLLNRSLKSWDDALRPQS